MKKAALFAFNGDPMCFAHVLLNALDLDSKGHDVMVVVEGSACKLVSQFKAEGTAIGQLFQQARQRDLIAGVCRACATKFGTLDDAKDQSLTILNDMSGHAGMAPFMAEGYEIISF